MKKSLPVLFAILLCAWAFSASAKVSAAIGQPAPAFTGTDSNGKTVSLADFEGKIVVLEWTSNECPFVKKHYTGGDMQKLQKQAAEKDIVWLSIDSSAPGKPGYLDAAGATEWLKSTASSPAHFVIDASGDIGRLYQAKTTPHMFVIGKDGVLAYAGAIDSIPSVDPADTAKATNYVQAAIDALAAGKPVSTAEVQSYGCGIKYGP